MKTQFLHIVKNSYHSQSPMQYKNLINKTTGKIAIVLFQNAYHMKDLKS